ncbi:MAG: DALR domain-containing protein, partial [Candidatus Brocadiia bacterium]
MAEFKKEINEIDEEGLISEREQNLCSIEDEVVQALDNDFNTARAIGEIFKKINPLMEKIFKGCQTMEDVQAGRRLIRIFEDILGIKMKMDMDVDSEEVEFFIKE